MSGYLTTFFFGIIIAIYFLIDGKMIGNYLKKVSKALFSNKFNNKIHDFLSDADKVFYKIQLTQFLKVLMFCSATLMNGIFGCIKFF